MIAVQREQSFHLKKWFFFTKECLKDNFDFFFLNVIGWLLFMCVFVFPCLMLETNTFLKIYQSRTLSTLCFIFPIKLLAINACSNCSFYLPVACNGHNLSSFTKHKAKTFVGEVLVLALTYFMIMAVFYIFCWYLKPSFMVE